MQPTIFTIDASRTLAAITKATRVGYPAQKIDMEAIVADGEDGFWIASEGRTGLVIPHALYHVDADGEIDEEIDFPEALMSDEKCFGSEVIIMVGEGEDMTHWIVIQREWRDDEKDMVKFLSYQPASETWGADARIKKLYWVSLSEMRPAELGSELPVVTKEKVHDFIPDLQAFGGYVVDKVEGFAADAFAVTDNDGVDDSSGETSFLKLGKM